MQVKSRLKAIAKYILRVIFFSILVGGLFKYFEKIPLSLLNIHPTIPTTFENFFLAQMGENILIFVAIVFSFLVCIFSELIITYLLAKICGLFKEIDKLKNWQSFLIVAILAIFFFEFSNILNSYKHIVSFNVRVAYGYVGVFLIPSYILYKYFKYLTKKHPTPFEKIGYYSSIEFYKGLFKKYKNEE